jgi:hypothetical protein
VPLNERALPGTGELALELLSGYGALDPGETVVGRVPDTPLGVIEKGTGMVTFELSDGEGNITVLSSVVELRVEVVAKEVSVAVNVNVSVSMRVDETVLIVEYEEEVPVPKPVTDGDEVPVGPASLEVVFDSGYGAVLDVPVSVPGATLAPEL